MRGWAEAVIKPAVDLGAKNLHRVRAGPAKPRARSRRSWRGGAAMLQPFLPSLEAEGELSLIYLDGEPSHAVRKRPAPRRLPRPVDLGRDDRRRPRPGGASRRSLRWRSTSSTKSPSTPESTSSPALPESPA